MNDDNASERTAALVHEVLKALQRAGNAPASPMNAPMTANLRRQLRRNAARLRQGKVEPRYKNVLTAAELAAIYERTVQRSEILEQALTDLKRIRLAFRPLVEENALAVGKTLEQIINEARQSAEEDGPESEASQRYQQLQFLTWLGRRRQSRHRRQRAAVSRF